MTTITLTPTQHAILAHAIEHHGGRIDGFPEHIKGGARQKVLAGLANRALITTDGSHWFVAAEGYDALGLPRPGAKTPSAGSFEARLDQIIANAEAATAAASDPEMEAAVTAAEAAWTRAKDEAPRRTRADSKQAQVIAMLRRPEGATIRQIMDATGWQAHTVRGTLAGALKKKLGLAIVSDKPQGGERVYRIVAQDAAA
ncbi:DUF3489 domain-containing protein [Ralstonia mannitolilytica]|uniref:Protein of uncharacterized function (DUF3489) n=1 Tax=Ralstonia mannitolilytica TaxID=105219 RepID=A0AAJ4ZIM8_9RALS|nr:DUF3489 domain-containing protein [Ralstonia mannitolilytica]CAG2153269.1 hypothetical protein LMG6866_04414 [Ralstonia mannitolilytica]SUD89595.1 Protein of uncharacterised function (DUF3489) [Ralstonia mannitolilytica]SUD95975.1 Protein of uncharacterised function (DUF3489) [Ralstonia mannitolilytica]